MPLSLSLSCPWFWLPLQFTGYPNFPSFPKNNRRKLTRNLCFYFTQAHRRNISKKKLAKVGFSSFQSYCTKFSFSAESSLVYVIILLYSLVAHLHTIFSTCHSHACYSFLSWHPTTPSENPYTIIKGVSRTIWIGGMANSQIALKAHVFLFHVWSPLPASIIFRPFIQRKSQTSVLQRVVGLFPFLGFFFFFWICDHTLFFFLLCIYLWSAFLAVLYGILRDS